MNYHHQKGTRVSKHSRSARTPFLRSGVFGVLSDQFSFGGSGARSLGGGGTAVLRGGGSGAPSLRPLAPLALAVAAVLALAAIPASALAARGHVFKGTFGTPGSGPGQLSEPSAVAVNEATGDVYVLDQGNARVVRFSSIGASA